MPFGFAPSAPASSGRAGLRTGSVLLQWSLFFVLLIVGALPVHGAEGESDNTVPLSVELQEKLARLNDQWLVWNTAFLQGNQATAGVAVRDMMYSVDDLGMETLPDLTLGMISRAVNAAREGETAKAVWGLEMAERMDPDRPETALGRSRVAALDKDWVSAAGHWVEAQVRLLESRQTRFLVLSNVLLWLLSALMLAGLLYVALLFATRGGRVVRALAGKLGILPTPLAYALILVVLVGPMFLPRGFIWVALLWMVLLWSACEINERWVLGGVCLLLGLAPVVVLQQQRGVEVAVSHQLRAVDSAIEGRLNGQLLNDLDRLRWTLPTSVAVTQLIADAHMRLGQDQVARPLYRQVAEEEPDNASAFINLGIFHSRRAEHFQAIPFYERAVEVADAPLVAYYNLAQAYRELLEFERADENLEKARAADAATLSRWIKESRTAQPLFGGFERRDVIRDELEATWDGASRSAADQLLSNASSAPLALLVPILGMMVGRGLHTPPGPPAAKTGFLDRALQFIVPGLPSAEDGRGVRAYLAALMPILAVTLPLIGYIGYRVPLGYDPGQAVTSVVGIGMLALFYLFRLPMLFRA